MSYEMVMVDWVDSAFHSGWTQSDDLDVAHCRTIGYLIHDGPDKLVVAMQHSEHSVGEAMAIPRVCVRRVTLLKLGRRKKE